MLRNKLQSNISNSNVGNTGTTVNKGSSGYMNRNNNNMNSFSNLNINTNNNTSTNTGNNASNINN